ncbi:uncharacterized protein LOC130561785 [Triplophysa rosa]|uniref:uncharacterized protein LOC130561785 n=1 Tax=Triplophysa rosa TaxID=992332 RepID=UPI0025462AA7|nr:uncharacterized protein LOC130561785 [Triplophysa rosa]
MTRPNRKFFSDTSEESDSFIEDDQPPTPTPTPPHQLNNITIRTVTTNRPASQIATAIRSAQKVAAAGPANPRAANTRHPAQRVADTHPAAQSVNTTRSPANRFKDTRFGAQMNPVNVTGSAQEVTATVPANQSITTSDYAMFIKLLTLLEEVKKTQRVHSNMLNALLKQRDHGPLQEVTDDVVFPLRTMEDVEAMNEKLDDSGLMSSVGAMVADVGGSSLDDATRRMMRFLISNDVAIEYNLFGRHGKRRFKDLRLFKVIYGGLKKNALTKNTNQKEAEKSLSKWFTGARDRGGKRALRAQNTRLPAV